MKKLFVFLLAAVMVLTMFGCGEEKMAAGDPIVIDKSQGGNAIGGFDDQGNLTYGGDPAVLVDGDTVYLYVGHDISSRDAYVIPEYLCYSSKDMVNWTYHGVTLNMKDVKWADKSSAWASQVAKHYDPVAGKDMYYLYFCSWDSTDGGRQSIGVAVSESPTGPFVDKGTALVKGSLTSDQTSAWNDIDPTVWIENDENGQEHIYLAWGNGRYYVCELNADMVSVKDLNGDGEVTFGADVKSVVPPSSFTEAPWIYRRRDENGNYYGDYYLFYACGWREKLAYATTSDLFSGEWNTTKVIMPPSVTSNTNHPAVVDFQGKTYMIYHNGSMPGGSGFRRVACIAEIKFNDDGSIDTVLETATGINGTISHLSNLNGDVLTHQNFVNSTADIKYPYVDIPVGSGMEGTNWADSFWEIVPGKADAGNEYYVSIESFNKAGLYLTVKEDNSVVLSQDHDRSMAEIQTFKTVFGLAGSGVSFESVAYPGMYLSIVNGVACLTDGSDGNVCTFNISVAV